MDLSQDIAAQMGMRVSPRLVAASYILELSSMELQQAIQAEIIDNPALELVERPTCQVCGGNLQGSICPNCLSQQKGSATGPEPEYDGADEYAHERSLASPADEDFDPMTQVASQQSLSERLINDLQAMVPRQDLPIGEYLVGNLNDNGYLACTVEEASLELGLPVARVELVLRALQSLEPIGIGARNLRECLLIQLEYLLEEGIQPPPGTREIVERHLTELAEHKFNRISAALGLPLDVVNAAALFIRQQLNPFPARGDSPPEPGTSEGNRSTYLLPDVIISIREGISSGQTGPAYNGSAAALAAATDDRAALLGYDPLSGVVDGNEFEVNVVESKRFFLRVTPLYSRLVSELEREPARYSDDEKRHIKEYVSRAKLFIANINQRRQTLQKITEYIVDAQQEFLRQGIRLLHPLTRATVAAQLGIHESTVSRATANKYVMLPNRKVIPFADFFTASLSVMDVIKELIANEAAPMTDQEIANELAKRSIPIARRTVAKYREQLNILPSSLR